MREAAVPEWTGSWPGKQVVRAMMLHSPIKEEVSTTHWISRKQEVSTDNFRPQVVEEEV